MRLHRPASVLPAVAGRSLAAALVGALVAGEAALAPAVAAASPLDDARAEAVLVEAQLESQGARVSELDERYNQARLAAERAERDLADAAAAHDSSEARLASAKERLAARATEAYIHGGAAPVLSELVRTRGTDLAVRSHYVERALHAADRALRAVETAERDLSRRTAALRKVRDANRDAEGRLAKDRDEAAAAVLVQEGTLARVRRDVARLVAADAARAAAENARRLRTRPSRPTVPPPAAHGAPTTTVPKPSVAPHDGGAAAVAEAVRQLGKPYLWAGAGPDAFDCSGLMLWAWRAAGVRLSHSAEYQYDETRRVDVGDLQPGDLVFFGTPIHHVGIYVGADTMIEAPHTGAVVRYRSIWRSDLVGAGRPH